MKKLVENLGIFFAIAIAVLIIIIGIFRLYFSFNKAGLSGSLLNAFFSFSLLIFIIAGIMLYCVIKNNVSLGYLVSSGIMAACSVRHFSEIIYCYFASEYVVGDISTNVLLGTVFMIFSSFLFYKGKINKYRHCKQQNTNCTK